jgi:hypothetical protein
MTERASSSWSIGRIAAVMVAVGIALFWIWVFSGAPARDNPDELDDVAYVDALEQRCQELRRDLDQLPPPTETPTATERAEVIAEANELLATFVDELEAGAPTEGDDAASVAGWLEDWRLYLANRQDYVERLREDPDARLLLDESELGDSVDRTIQIFAEVNRIPDCATPGDVG